MGWSGWLGWSLVGVVGVVRVVTHTEIFIKICQKEAEILPTKPKLTN